MAKDLNKVQLTGNLGADPDMRYTAQGSAVTTFRVASNRTWKDRDGNTHEDTEWFRIVAWDKLGEICNQYLTKGTRVYVEGRLQTRKWTDQNGQERYSTEVIAQDMIILSGRGERGMPEADAPPAYDDYDAEPSAPAAAPRRAAPANGNGGNRTAPAASRSSAPSRPQRNVPQSIDSDDDIPF